MVESGGDRWNYLPGFKGAKTAFDYAWPALLSGDSELQRRKKRIVRGMQTAVALMVTVSIGGAVIAQWQQMSLGRLLFVALAGFLYVVWNVYGMRGAIALLLWEQGEPPTQLHSPELAFRHAIHFAVQLALAAGIYYAGDAGGGANLLWLILLPPIAHSVVLLRWTGVAAVIALSTFILLADVVRTAGWNQAFSAFLLFSFAALFTCIFTQLAVSSEKSRGEVQRLAAQLAEANVKLREYAVQAEELASARERNRIAREIHDTLGHYLTVVNVQIAAARAVRELNPGQADDAIAKAQDLTQEGLSEIRRSVSALRATPLDNKTLISALNELIQNQQASGLRVRMEMLGAERTLSPQVELTLYRSVQEGLTNARKHAPGAAVRITLDFQNSDAVRVAVEDNGPGAQNGEKLNSGFGLLGLRERVQLLGGVVRIQTMPGLGFALEVEVRG